MNLKLLVSTVRNLILNPAEEWNLIYSENRSASFLSRNLLMPLVILLTVSGFLGSVLFINTELTIAYSFLKAVKFLIVYPLTVYASGYLFKESARFAGRDIDYNDSFRIIACSAVPLLLCQIISLLFESFIFVNILAFYGLYIFWTGLEKPGEAPEERKKLIMLITGSAIFLVVFIILNWLFNLLTDKIYFSALS